MTCTSTTWELYVSEICAYEYSSFKDVTFRTGHVAQMQETKNAYKTFKGKPFQNWPLRIT
jgi:hypothetical protein